ncbi:MAG: 50S ribosomal protein L6 [Oceanococcaceae bacterium]
MSRVAKQDITLPKGVEFRADAGAVTVKGAKGQLQMRLHPDVLVTLDDKTVSVGVNEGVPSMAQAGTARALLANMVHGVSEGFERKLELVGVGYRAQAKGKVLSLSLGYSHPVDYQLPDGVTAETPTQTEIVLRGADKQQLGQVAAEVRAWRPPEPYKGKGIKYAGEVIRRKEAKKK